MRDPGKLDLDHLNCEKGQKKWKEVALFLSTGFSLAHTIHSLWLLYKILFSLNTALKLTSFGYIPPFPPEVSLILYCKEKFHLWQSWRWVCIRKCTVSSPVGSCDTGGYIWYRNHSVVENFRLEGTHQPCFPAHQLLPPAWCQLQTCYGCVLSSWPGCWHNTQLFFWVFVSIIKILWF